MENCSYKCIPEDNELVKLIDKLITSAEDTGEWIVASTVDQRPQVVFYDEYYNRIADAICSPYSYGGEQGLIEVFGKPLCCVEDEEVEGWLTADTVFARWMNWLKEKKVKSLEA